ncbi:hypothetical protein [Paenibacillus sp. GCM10027626]|uniref:hypothetical protein n=1 Tax=Paenibacillus sp. GCM10027626 TaxID=3273411 RepID=UPI003640B389
MPRRGVWEGKRLLSESWVEEASSVHISNGNGGDSDWAQGYGYQFWRCRYGVYRGDGAFGQFCIIMPEHDAVMAITSADNDMQAILNAVWEHVLPAFAPAAPLPDDGKGAAHALRSELGQLVIEPPRHEMSSALETAVSGFEYVLDTGHHAALAVRFDMDTALLTLTNEQGRFDFQLGRGKWVHGTTSYLGAPARAAVGSFTWLQANTLEATIRLIETPFCLTLQVKYSDDAAAIELEQRQNVYFGASEPIAAKGRRQ